MSAFSERVRSQTKGLYKVADFEGGKEVTHTISHLDEEMEMFGKTLDILNFSDTGRQLSVNQTNAEFLLDKFGDNPEKWAGQNVTLYLAEYEYGDKRGQFASSCRATPPSPSPRRAPSSARREMARQKTPRVWPAARLNWTTKFPFDAGAKARKPIEPPEPDPGPGWLRSRVWGKTHW